MAMVQREVADRLAAAPGGKSYGATSVLAQLACECACFGRCRAASSIPCRTSSRRSWRCAARARAARRAVALVHAGFAHRRKALAGSLALAPGAPEDIRAATRAALEEIGHPADARASACAPGLAAAGRAIGAARVASLRPARSGRLAMTSASAPTRRSTWCSTWARRGRRAAPALLAVRLDRAGGRARGRSRRPRRGQRREPGRGGPEPGAAARSRRSASAPACHRVGAPENREAHPRRGGPGWRQRRRRRHASDAQPHDRHAARPPGLLELAAGLGSDVPSQLEPRHALVQGTGDIVEPVALPESSLSSSPAQRAVAPPTSTPSSTASAAGATGSTPGRCARWPPAPDRLAAALENDLQPAALSLRPELDATLERCVPPARSAPP